MTKDLSPKWWDIEGDDGSDLQEFTELLNNEIAAAIRGEEIQKKIRELVNVNVGRALRFYVEDARFLGTAIDDEPSVAVMFSEIDYDDLHARTSIREILDDACSSLEAIASEDPAFRPDEMKDITIYRDPFVALLEEMLTRARAVQNKGQDRP